MVMLKDGQCLRIPNNLIPPWQFQVFRVKAAGFCKNWGVSTRVDVVLYSMGRIGHHITRAEYRGKFLKQKFYICRHRIQNGLGWNWHSGAGRAERDGSSMDWLP
jgi:hypothetical protein